MSTTNAGEPLRIVQLEARNVKRIKAVRIRPAGNMVKITGLNDQGKTSVIDCIWYAMGGKAATKDTPMPIRDGERSAETSLRLAKMVADPVTGKWTAKPSPDDLIVTRKWTATDSYLTVTTADGTPIKSPQALLDRLSHHLAFDPLAFANMEPAKQVEILKAVAGLDFAGLDAKRADAYAQRRAVNQEVDRLTGALAKMPLPDPELPADELSAADLLAEQKRAAEVERERARMNAEIDGHAREVAKCEADLARLQAEMTRVTELRERLSREVAELRAAMPEPVDIGDMQERLAEIEETNLQIRQAKGRAELEARLEAAKAQSRELTETIAGIDEQKRNMLANARMPIDGLGLGDDGVTYQGVPFSQISSSARLKVSLAMAMALNPVARVIRITDGSLLDANNMATIKNMADARGFQIWIEVVSDGTAGDGWVIEDGEVAAEPETAG